MKRELVFRNYKTGQIGQRVDVTGESDHNVTRVLRGMLINKHNDWLVHDTADGPLPASGNAQQSQCSEQENACEQDEGA